MLLTTRPLSTYRDLTSMKYVWFPIAGFASGAMSGAPQALRSPLLTTLAGATPSQGHPALRVPFLVSSNYSTGSFPPRALMPLLALLRPSSPAEVVARVLQTRG